MCKEPQNHPQRVEAIHRDPQPIPRGFWNVFPGLIDGGKQDGEPVASGLPGQWHE